MSFVEVLIVMGILGVVLSVMYQALIPALRGLNRTSADTDTQQAVVIASEKIREELRLSTPYSITNTGNAISFLSPKTPLPSAVTVDLYGANVVDGECEIPDVVWRKYLVVYFHQQSSTIRMKELPITPTSVVRKLVPASLSTYAADGQYKESVMARNIYNVDFYVPRFPCVMVDVVAYKTHTGLDLSKARPESYSRVVHEILPQN
ncbi:MAG: hypothetical protein RDV48_08580 [Candidatus Eremiobacteraeota bacterium]|nr:hypothetical protein [Candidatus Eremiobacteraeota bacterium]